MGTPISMACTSALRQLAWYLFSALEKKSSSSRLARFGIFVEGGLDVAQEDAADDAAAAPHQRDAAHVQVPALVLLRGAQQHVTLRVADHLGAVERAANILDELFCSATVLVLPVH